MAGYHKFASAPLEGTPLEDGLKEALGVREEVAVPYHKLPKRLRWLVILLTEAGEAINEAGMRRIAQQPGSIVVQPRGFICGDRTIRLPWRTRYILLTGPWADQFQAQFWSTGRLQTELYDSPPPVWRRLVVDIVETIFEQPPAWSWRVMAKLGALFDTLLQHPPQGHPYGDLLERVQHLVADDPENPWRLTDLAAALRMDSRTLTRRFQRVINQPPAVWVRQQRMRLARKLLLQGMSVVAVAEHLGFADSFCFSRQFKKVMRTPPSCVRTRPPSRYAP